MIIPMLEDGRYGVVLFISSEQLEELFKLGFVFFGGETRRDTEQGKYQEVVAIVQDERVAVWVEIGVTSQNLEIDWGKGGGEGKDQDG